MAYKLTYANQGKTRSLPLSEEVAKAYELAAQQAAIDEIRVLSGGQPSTGPNRTGSHRHDEGGAGDIQLVRGGSVLDFTDPEDLPIIQKWISAAKQSGLTGFGAGEDYMGKSTIHAGGGAPAVWGAGGASANAPDWLKQAVGTTLTSTPTPTSAPVETAAAPTEKPAATPFETAMEKLGPIAKGLSGQVDPQVAAANAEITPTSLTPNMMDPRAAQALMSNLMNKRRNPMGVSLATSGMV